jgi:hypothetical protein
LVNAEYAKHAETSLEPPDLFRIHPLGRRPFTGDYKQSDYGKVILPPYFGQCHCVGLLENSRSLPE